MKPKTILPTDLSEPQSVFDNHDKAQGRRPFVSLAARVTPEFGMRFTAFLQYQGKSHKHALIDAVLKYMREEEGKMTRAEKTKYLSYLLRQGELDDIPNMNRPLEQFEVDPALYRVARGRPIGSRDRGRRAYFNISDRMAKQPKQK